MPRSVKVAACQTLDIRGDIEFAISTIEHFAKQAEAEAVDPMLFPEGFLQGYLTKKDAASRNAIDLESAEFGRPLSRLAKVGPMLVFGLIEASGSQLFNTAVVMDQGVLIGRYRKTHLLPGEICFRAGQGYPIFNINGLKFGINICYDMQFSEAATAVANQGATLILCPANNMIQLENAVKWKHRHHDMRIKRAKESGTWVLSADVTGERNGQIGYGPTSLISPDGSVVTQVPLLETGMIIAKISIPNQNAI